MKIVIALGGNALQANPKDLTSEAQLFTSRETAKSLVDLIEEGHTVAIVHGNGPQVGQIMNTLETANKVSGSQIPVMPFDVCGAFSQGYIGYHLQKSIEEELKRRGIKKPVGTVITQMLVDKEDSGFKNPTKPIGSFYSKEEAEKLMKEKGYMMKEDAGRGWRRVVASPKPIDIVEKEIIHTMISSGMITISCGGGGIPVIYEEDRIEGIAAVIDKDFAAEKLAEVIDADILLILTAVDKICVNYNKFNQKEISNINIDKLNEYIEEGQFAPGSMLPKVEAAKKFVQFDKNKIAIIASLSKAMEALNETSGTRIVR
ncbi:carbamate kinase [Clostridium sp. HMP27]|uniref:carbamate kinase n=1 Tax=Clostridium sp. HMP27 TaxID=1487921 RepID=UPI00052CFA07|nr:carbamate kinase [Clostridium sp. HMP27]KGK88208.1 carbamate kinase [Clostridium sp. HMP27]